jgi:hypothetical protein
LGSSDVAAMNKAINLSGDSNLPFDDDILGGDRPQ